jgi:hypothetical protein
MKRVAITGFNGSIGKEICEGDILSWEEDEKKRRRWRRNGDGQGDLAIVEWYSHKNTWIGSIASRYGGGGCEKLTADNYKNDWIILGNIFENPKLLK